MEVTVNGEPRRVVEGATLAEFLSELGLGRFPYAVERNQEVVPKGEHSVTVLRHGDALEVVTFVGGG